MNASMVGGGASNKQAAASPNNNNSNDRLVTTANTTPRDAARSPSSSSSSSSSTGLLENLTLESASKRKRDDVLYGVSSNKSLLSNNNNNNIKMTMHNSIQNTKDSATMTSSSNNKTGNSVSPMTLVNLGNAAVLSLRRGNTMVLPTNNNTSSRFPRRNSSVGDVFGTQNRASELVSPGVLRLDHHRRRPTTTMSSSDASAASLGYGEDTGTTAMNREASRAVTPADLGYDETAPPTSMRRRLQLNHQPYAPPAKRQCRYQRRNSFVIPETSRAKGQGPGFSWKAMEFIYGVPPPPPAVVDGTAGSSESGLPTLPE